MHTNIPRIILVGAGSGCGKTTLTCALLLLLKKRGLNPVGFKCGPDYIDPMFHTKVLGVPSRNLDIFLCGEESVKYLLAENAIGHGFAVLEGVMGLYDGLGQTDACSSNHLAKLTATPEVLVINTKGQSLSLVAQIYGYQQFLPNTLAGVIFNQTSAAMYPVYKNMVEEQLGLTVYGYVPPLPQASLESRHLGLVSPGEREGIQEKLELVAQTAKDSLDIEGLLALGRSSAPLEYTNIEVRQQVDLTLAVARDKAFCFYYEDNLDLLRRLGAKIEFFSPLTDTQLPPDACGLLLGGGYPEEHVATLSTNTALLLAVKKALQNGLPTLAECGGYAYLCRSLQTLGGQSYPLANVIDAEVRMTPSLKRFGYVTLTAEQDTFLCKKGSQYHAHEFHYSDSTNNGNSFTAVKASGAHWQCMHTSGNVFAGYPHLHFWGNIALAQAFLANCAAYQEK